MSYICEAKPILVQEEESENATSASCHFPFVVDDVEFHHCTTSVMSEIDTFGEPWCATRFEASGNESLAYGICPDEKRTAVKGGSEGEPCFFPFLMNEK